MDISCAVQEADGVAEVASFVLSLFAVLVSVILSIWTVRTLHRVKVAAKYGFYVNFLGYLELLLSDLSKGDGSGDYILAVWFDENVRSKVGFKGAVAKPEELSAFSDLCLSFRNFLLSCENNICPRGLAKKAWTKHQLTLVKFLYKCEGLGSILRYGTKEDKKSYEDERHNVMEALTELSRILRKALKLPDVENPQIK